MPVICSSTPSVMMVSSAFCSRAIPARPWQEPKLLETFGEAPGIDPAPPDEFQYFKIDCSTGDETWTQIGPLAADERDERPAKSWGDRAS
jgi:hypothetical protein